MYTVHARSKICLCVPPRTHRPLRQPNILQVAQILILGNIKNQKYVVTACCIYLYWLHMMPCYTQQCLKDPAVSKLPSCANLPGCANIPGCAKILGGAKKLLGHKCSFLKKICTIVPQFCIVLRILQEKSTHVFQ